MPVRIALDAYGGDFAPTQVVAGARAAARPDVEILLVGPRAGLETALGAAGAASPHIRIVDATEVIGMDEHPAQAVRSKKDSSIVVGIREVADGRADAFVSAGNSGAIMAAALFGFKRIEGISRPAIGSRIPTVDGEAFLLDVGANAECEPRNLRDFALMGAVYAEKLMGKAHPRVGLLSIGEEASKGNRLIQGALALLATSGLNLIGNVEGKDLFRGNADVIVADGFAGNVAIKTAEGAAEFLLGQIREALRRDPLGMAAGLVLRRKLGPLRRRIDWREYGGALLLGVNGVAVIAHGRSDARAIASACRVAVLAVEREIVTTIRAAVMPLAVARGEA
jgi:glycerol-3-phosphate acyltransferase PlsX